MRTCSSSPDDPAVPTPTPRANGSLHRDGSGARSERVELAGPHARLLAREGIASSLYLALVLLGAVVATPADSFPSDRVAIKLLLGTALGLVLAHWLAFRLAARLTDSSGGLTATAGQEAGAQILGALAVALAATGPFLVLDGRAARISALLVLAALPASAGLMIARLNGLGWSGALLRGAVVLVLATVVVAVKASVDH